jgi:hypothetical protein
MRYRLLLLCFVLAPAFAARAQSGPTTPTEVAPYRYCKVFVDEHVVRPLDQLRIVYEKATRGAHDPEMRDCTRQAHSVPEVLAYLQQHGWELLPSPSAGQLPPAETCYLLRRLRG